MRQEPREARGTRLAHQPMFSFVLRELGQFVVTPPMTTPHMKGAVATPERERFVQARAVGGEANHGFEKSKS